MRLLPALALLLVLAGPSAGKKGKKARGKKAAAKAREVEVTFTEPGPLGLDFLPEKLSGGRVGLKVKGIAPGSHASQFAQLGAGMRLVSVADDSGGVTVHTEMSAASGPELAALAKTALGDTRPITVRFSGSPKKVQPGDATALIQEGTRLGQQGRLPEAVATMERAVALKPDLAEAHYNLGIGYDRAKRGAEAVHAFRTALALKPELPKPMALTLWETAQAAAEGGAEGEATSMESCRAERGAEACEAELRSAHRLGETHRVVPLLSAADAASTRTAIYGTPLLPCGSMARLTRSGCVRVGREAADGGAVDGEGLLPPGLHLLRLRRRLPHPPARSRRDAVGVQPPRVRGWARPVPYAVRGRVVGGGRREPRCVGLPGGGGVADGAENGGVR